MLVHDLLDVLGLYAAVEAALGIDDHDGAQCAQAEAACHDDFDFVLEADSLDFLVQLIDDFGRAGRSAAGAAAYQNMGSVHMLKPPSYFSDAPMVYSVTTFLLIMWSTTTLRAISAVIFT
ncbi:hypothetical protein SDC9_65105 [bioreactor metagenome]|uniref:Uncharacterized protein n=1 Tax=bioreactor metagenome TaxID=1076179 RepID=A0A644XR31_9ZZZZ